MTQAPVPKTAGAQETSMTDSDIRATLDQHWAASDANDFELEHQIYREDAGAGISAVGRADTWETQYTDHPNPAAKQETLQSPARDRSRRFMGYRICNPVRRAAVLYDQLHGVRGRQGCAGNAIFRRSI